MFAIVNVHNQVARPFTITIGLGGYREGILRALGEVWKVIGGWLLHQEQRNRPCLLGVVTEGTSGHEPVLIYRGEISPDCLEITDNEVLSVVDELAELLAQALNQNEVHSHYKGMIHILKRQ